MSLILDSTVGLEDVQRQALYVLLDHLSDALAAVAERWEPRDRELADRLDIPYVPTVLEAIPNVNYHEGHVPSLINAPVERYPNVATMCLRATPGPGSDELDHADFFLDSLVIDVMVKSNESEQEVNRRAHRTAEAVNLCIQSNSTLYGTVDGINTAPTVDISDVFVRRDKEKGHYGQEWYWQGARLSYGVRKFAPAASSSGAFLRSAGVSIDQS